MTDMVQTPEAFDFGRVMNRAFVAIRRNLKTFLLAALILVGIPYFVVSIGATLFVVSQMNGGGIDDISAGMVGGMAAVGFLTLAVMMIAGSVLQGAVTHTSINDFNDEQTSLNESMSTGLGLALPLIGLGILMGLGIIFGLMLFIVPGVFLICMWAVAAPALVVERVGVTDSLGRSIALTSGYRWWVLLIFIVAFALSMGIGMVGGILKLPVAMGSNPLLGGGFGVSSIYTTLIDTVIQAITTMIGTVVVASLYFELRYLKEGVGADSLASVFD